MTIYNDMTENPSWEDKAIGFIARSRTELWGRHNEDILALLHVNGFKIRFVKDTLIGWNKRPKERPAAQWGFGTDFTDGHAREGQLYLPEGLVIPYFIGPKLKKLMIIGLDDNSKRLPYRVPGSSQEPFIYPGNPDSLLITWDLMAGLYAHQELGNTFSVIIFDSDTPIRETMELDWVKKAGQVVLISDKNPDDADIRMVDLTMQWPSIRVIRSNMIDGFAKAVRNEESM